MKIYMLFIPRFFTPIPCLSITRVICVKTAERIIEIFLPSDRPIILVFRHQGSLRKSGASPPTEWSRGEWSDPGESGVFWGRVEWSGGEGSGRSGKVGRNGPPYLRPASVFSMRMMIIIDNDDDECWFRYIAVLRPLSRKWRISNCVCLLFVCLFYLRVIYKLWHRRVCIWVRQRLWLRRVWLNTSPASPASPAPLSNVNITGR